MVKTSLLVSHLFTIAHLIRFLAKIIERLGTFPYGTTESAIGHQVYLLNAVGCLIVANSTLVVA